MASSRAPRRSSRSVRSVRRPIFTRARGRMHRWPSPAPAHSNQRSRARSCRCIDRPCSCTTSAPGLGSFLPHLHRIWARPCHICTGTGLTPATSAPALGSPPPHLHRDWAHPRQIRSDYAFNCPTHGMRCMGVCQDSCHRTLTTTTRPRRRTPTRCRICSTSCSSTSVIRRRTFADDNRSNP